MGSLLYKITIIALKSLKQNWSVCCSLNWFCWFHSGKRQEDWAFERKEEKEQTTTSKSSKAVTVVDENALEMTPEVTTAQLTGNCFIFRPASHHSLQIFFQWLMTMPYQFILTSVRHQKWLVYTLVFLLCSLSTWPTTTYPASRVPFDLPRKTRKIFLGDSACRVATKVLSVPKREGSQVKNLDWQGWQPDPTKWKTSDDLVIRSIHVSIDPLHFLIYTSTVSSFSFQFKFHLIGQVL